MADTKLVCSWFLKDALTKMTAEEISGMQGHFKRYYVWMKAQAFSSQIAPVGPEEKAALIAKVPTDTANGALMCNVGPHLADILCGRVSPLELMQDNDLLQRFYDECVKLDRSRNQMAELVRLNALKHPRAKILEIGAWSGGPTYNVLNAFGAENPLCASYDVTDVSDIFFEAAEENLAGWKSLLSFQTLDIIAVHVVEIVLVVLRGNLPESGMKGWIQRHHGPFSIGIEANSRPNLAKGSRSLIYHEFDVALEKTDSQS